MMMGVARAQEETPAEPETHTVEAAPFKVEVSLSGVFEAEQMTEVSLQPDVFSNFVVEKAVPQGTHVKQGDPILWFETDDIDDQLRDMEFSLELSRLSVKQAELELASLEASVPLDLRAAERAKEEADKDLEYYNRAGAEMARRSAEESLKSSEYGLEYAQEELDQLEQMYKADDLTEETEEIILKRARRDVEQSSFYLENARLRHERTISEELPRQQEQTEEAVVRAQIALERAQATLPSSIEEKRISLQKLQFSQQQEEEQYAKLKADRELMVVEAPAAGIVYYGQCERGTWPMGQTIAKQLRPRGNVAPNQVLMTIVGEGPAFIRVTVPEADLRFAKAENRGFAIPTAYPQQRLPAISGGVDPIPIADGQFDGRVDFQLEQGAVPIVAGMNCTVKLTGYSKPDALAVPTSAIFSEEADDTQKYVLLYKEGTEPEKRSVIVGEASGEKTEITSGLAAGDRILLKKPE
jgi:multidrug resistance efflux pump